MVLLIVFFIVNKYYKKTKTNDVFVLRMFLMTNYPDLDWLTN